MGNIKLAKRAAALEVCKQLHQCGEFDDYLMPNIKGLPDEDLTVLLPLWEDEQFSANAPKTGTTNRARLYQLLVSSFTFTLPPCLLFFDFFFFPVHILQNLLSHFLCSIIDIFLCN